MRVFKLPILYLIWHYSTSLKHYWQIAITYVWFVWHFFSIHHLSKTMFKPWRRMSEHTHGHFLGDLIVNTALIGVGVVMRVATVAVGTIVLIVFIVGSVVGFALWLLLPALIIALFGFGLISFTIL